MQSLILFLVNIGISFDTTRRAYDGISHDDSFIDNLFSYNKRQIDWGGGLKFHRKTGNTNHNCRRYTNCESHRIKEELLQIQEELEKSLKRKSESEFLQVLTKKKRRRKSPFNLLNYYIEQYIRVMIITLLITSILVDLDSIQFT